MCVLQCVCSRKAILGIILKVCLALWDYFWFLGYSGQVIPAFCWVEGWHKGLERWEDLRRVNFCPLEESCFRRKIMCLHDSGRNISLALFPYSMTEVSQLCVWIWRLQLYEKKSRSKMWLRQLYWMFLCSFCVLLQQQPYTDVSLCRSTAGCRGLRDGKSQYVIEVKWSLTVKRKKKTNLEVTMQLKCLMTY